MNELLDRLKQRKLVQWTLAYVAAAFALLQGLDIVAQQFGWADGVRRGITIALIVGFFLTLVLAWYHGERGAQRVTGTELLILALLLMIGGGLLWRQAQNPAAAVSAAAAGNTLLPAKSIAVLAFSDLSPAHDQEYFSDGMSEEILDALAKVKDLKVAGRTSSFSFKGKNEDVREIGKVLGVANVLEGSVQKSGDAVRITAQLIDTRSGYHLWSEKYDRTLTSIFAVEDEISKAITDKLQVQLAVGEPLLSAQPIDPRAHELYLRGLTLLAARGPSLRDAADTFQQAVTIDPHYAQAWAALAQAEALVWNWHLEGEGAAQARAESAAQQALAIDPNVATAYVALGILHDDRWQWADADRAFHRAVELAPGDAEVLDQYAQFLLAVGQLEPALREIEQANRLDPLSGIIGSVHGQILLALHRCDEASTQIARTLQIAPSLRHANGIALFIALACRPNEALAQGRRYATSTDKNPDVYAALVQGVLDPAQRAQALRLAKDDTALGLRRNWEKTYWLLLLGDRENAMTALENHFADGPIVGGVERLWLPVFDPLRGDPRFKAVLAKIGIPYQPAQAGTTP